MDMTGRAFVGVFLAFVLVGLFAWADRNLTLECRSSAQAKGASIADAVKLCDR